MPTEKDIAASREADEPTIELMVTASRGKWVVEAGAGAIPSVCSLDEGTSILVGTDEACELRVLDLSVSRRHCRISFSSGGAVVEDLGSRNGTFVGGARVERATLLPGASVILGRTVLTCRVAAETEHAGVETPPPLPGVVGRSTAMLELFRDAWRLAGVKAPVLLQGETGTGKDVIARAMHHAGPRKRHPFVVLNVGTLPRELADAELFGHERGAFTGAHVAREGAFVEADGGTLFLDEIGDLAPDLQVKLLRVLEDGEVRAVGGRTRRRVNVRVVSATWVPLEQRVAQGAFRQDLYQRLAVCVLNVPPLRARRSDLPELARHLLDQLRDEVGACEIAPAALARLCMYSFPGNVRELKNILYRAALRCTGRTIRPADLDSCTATSGPGRPAPLTAGQANLLVASLGGNVSAAARQAGVPRSTFRDWMRTGT